jgi:hypothetical protein
MEQTQLTDMISELTERQASAARLNLVLDDSDGEWHLRCQTDRMSVARMAAHGQFFYWTIEQILGRTTDHYVRYHE